MSLVRPRHIAWGSRSSRLTLAYLAPSTAAWLAQPWAGWPQGSCVCAGCGDAQCHPVRSGEGDEERRGGWNAGLMAPLEPLPPYTHTHLQVHVLAPPVRVVWEGDVKVPHRPLVAQHRQRRGAVGPAASHGSSTASARLRSFRSTQAQGEAHAEGAVPSSHRMPGCTFMRCCSAQQAHAHSPLAADAGEVGGVQHGVDVGDLHSTNAKQMQSLFAMHRSLPSRHSDSQVERSRRTRPHRTGHRLPSAAAPAGGQQRTCPGKRRSASSSASRA